MANLTLPEQAQPVVDPQTGRMTPEWYRLLRQLVTIINGGL